MGEDKWIRRKPGRVSGTVVPPPAGGDLPPLPQRRGLGRPRFHRDALGQGLTRFIAPDRPERPDNSKYTKNSKGPESRESSEGSEHSTFAENSDSPVTRENADFHRNSKNSQNPESPQGPDLPANVRQLFPPVLHARTIQSATARDLHPSAGRVKRADLPTATGRIPATAWPAVDRRPTTDVPPATDPQAVSDGPPAASPASANVSSTGQSVADSSLVVAWGTAPQQSRAVRRTMPRGWRRRIGHRPAAAPGGRRQVLWMVGLTVLLLVTAAGTLVALMRQPGTGGVDRAAMQGHIPGAPGAAAARLAAARWVAGEVSRSEIIGCDTIMCTALVNAGVPSSDLLVIKPTAPDPLGADVVVATPVLQSQFGRRLRTEYAPAVLASFGRGSSTVAVRLVATYGASAYELALRRDLAARQAAGTQLIGNNRIGLPATAETQLVKGQVDPRLLITLPALAAKHPIRVVAFFDRAPGASSGVPLAGVELSGAGPHSGMSPHEYLSWLTSFLRSQHSTYRAASVSTATHDGQPVVSVRFTWPTPFGLLH
jgi:hypothetical protein